MRGIGARGWSGIRGGVGGGVVGRVGDMDMQGGRVVGFGRWGDGFAVGGMCRIRLSGGMGRRESARVVEGEVEVPAGLVGYEARGLGVVERVVGGVVGVGRELERMERMEGV